MKTVVSIGRKSPPAIPIKNARRALASPIPTFRARTNASTAKRYATATGIIRYADFSTTTPAASFPSPNHAAKTKCAVSGRACRRRSRAGKSRAFWRSTGAPRRLSTNSIRVSNDRTSFGRSCRPMVMTTIFSMPMSTRRAATMPWERGI